MHHVLFVCLGNICRSPLAEGVLRDRLTGQPDAARWTIDSAGLGGWHAGQAPDRRAVATAAAHGVDLSGQRARPITADDFQRFQWVVALDAEVHGELRRMQARAGATDTQVVEMIEFVPTKVRQGLTGVPDPYYGGQEGFERVWELLTAGMAQLEAAVRAS